MPAEQQTELTEMNRCQDCKKMFKVPVGSTRQYCPKCSSKAIHQGGRPKKEAAK